MTKGQKQVSDFMKFFGQGTPQFPEKLDEETSRLRAKLILEEALETLVKGLGLEVTFEGPDGRQIFINRENLKYWIGKDEDPITFKQEADTDLKELADGLADLAYVGEFGTAIAAGIDLEPIQDEVHRSNMTKAWREGDLEKAKELYPNAKVENYGGGLYRLIREDGKVIKSPSYEEAKIQEILDKQIKRAKAQGQEVTLGECPKCGANALLNNRYAKGRVDCIRCGYSSVDGKDTDLIECPACGANAFSKEMEQCQECGSGKEPK